MTQIEVIDLKKKPTKRYSFWWYASHKRGIYAFNSWQEACEHSVRVFNAELGLGALKEETRDTPWTWDDVEEFFDAPEFDDATAICNHF